jgi:hypothetical protein
MFKSTKPDSYSENRKADIKNYNLPFLQHMYMGDSSKPLECLITKTPGFMMVPDIVTGLNKLRFRLDFNHIRQRESDHRHAGISLDKSSKAPSSIFREYRFDSNVMNKRYLFEFMTIMPICTEYHAYISQDSAKGDITLKNYNKKDWPWVLANEQNYNTYCETYNIVGIPYEQMIDHLSDIRHPSILARLRCNNYKQWSLV